MSDFQTRMQPILATERPRMTAAVDDYICQTAGMSIHDRIKDTGRKPFLMERFPHLKGITKAYVVAQCSMSATRLVHEQHLASLPDADKIFCEDGWRSLVDRFLSVGHQQRGWLFKSAGEKWGGLELRYACDPVGVDACRTAEKEAFEASLQTCEKCGNSGRLRGKTQWRKTLCDVHAGKAWDDE